MNALDPRAFHFGSVNTMTDTDVQAPKIEFPCKNYPIKVIGEAGDGFADLSLIHI